MAETFTVNPQIQQAAEILARGAVEDAKDIFEISLDWSDASIQLVEQILGELHDELAQTSFSEEQIFELAKTYGSYIGEVFRRNHGASWGIISLQGQSVPGLQAAQTPNVFWPWIKANERLTAGPEDNVWHYYQHLLEKHG